MKHESIVENLFVTVESNDDLDYQKVAKDASYEDVRSYINQLWVSFKLYADAKFSSGFRKHFHERLWELWLGNYLLDEGFELKTGGNTKWPDFYPKKDGQELLIEAMCVGNADSEDAIKSLPEIKWSEQDKQVVVKFEKIEIERYELRYQHAIDKKYFVNKSKLLQMRLPYIIAISGEKLPYSDFSFGETVPTIVKALFPVGEEGIVISEQQDFSVFREKKSVNHNHKGVKKTKEIFSSDQYTLISGVIFSSKSFVCNKRDLKDGLVLIRNPFAKFPLPYNLSLQEYVFKYTGDAFTLQLK